jgi:hypothetical protein
VDPGGTRVDLAKDGAADLAARDSFTAAVDESNCFDEFTQGAMQDSEALRKLEAAGILGRAG